MEQQNILLAGATGYLGRHIAAQLANESYNTTLIVRNKQKANFNYNNCNVIEAEVTQPDTLNGVLNNIDVVISTVGITRQKDGLTYMDVDYQANINLLNEAKKAGVKKFIYISAINGDKLRHLKIFQAKEAFVDALTTSGLDYCIIRPNGFFSDMGDFLEMAKRGTVYLFGDGNYKLNPIHGTDLAKVCVNAINNHKQEIIVGGPDVLSHNQLATMALDAWGKKHRIMHLPDWIRKFTIWIMRTFTSSKTYGPIEFFLTAMASDNIAPTYGEHHLKDFFEQKTKQPA